MTKNIAFGLFLLYLFVGTGFAQTKKAEYLTYNQLYLVVGSKQLKFSSINDKSIGKLLGSPVKISTKPWETAAGEKTKTYYYKGFRVYTVDGSLEFIEIDGPQAALSFLMNKQFSKPFAPGKSADMVNQSFPTSWTKKNKNGLFIEVIDPAGKADPASIRFTFSGNTIKTVEFAENES